MSSAAELLERLHALNDELLLVDRAALTDEALQQLMVGVRAELCRLSVVAADDVHDWFGRGAWLKDGSLNASLALARDTHRAESSARRDLRRAEGLQRMPATREALLTGRLSLDHLDLFMRHATPQRLATFLEHEDMLVAKCAGFKLFDSAMRLLRHWADRVDDMLGLDRTKPEPSTLYASRCGADGTLVLNGEFSPVDAEIVATELKRLCRLVHLDDKRNKIHRTPAQRRAAALVLMATRSLNSTGATARPLFQVIAGDKSAQWLCQLASGQVVHPDDLTPYVDTAFMESFLFDGPRVIISKSKLRTFSGALRKAIQVRDRFCQHASGCPHPAADADIDHIVEWAAGGETTQFNGRVGCMPHNRHRDLRDNPEPLPARVVDERTELQARLHWRSHHRADGSDAEPENW